ncbi:hypothetical protein Hanom_Chr11g01062441 [Helianthus anomalus]
MSGDEYSDLVVDWTVVVVIEGRRMVVNRDGSGVRWLVAGRREVVGGGLGVYGGWLQVGGRG